jgi:lysine 6-dehydrogenase
VRQNHFPVFSNFSRRKFAPQFFQKMNIAVLGAGMVGRAIAADLCSAYGVTAFDANRQQLKKLQEDYPAVKTQEADLSQYNQYESWLKPFDIVVTALPGFMGFKALEAVIRAGKNAVDISFFPENALELDALAKEKNVTVITDCGVAPGLSNLILGRCNEEMKVDSFACYVGGLPEERKKPFEYKAPFSPVDVIEEYIRPARLMEKGKIVIKPALSEKEIISIDGIGELEAFNTDGLRSLLFTMQHIPDMKEKTLRYPGHIDLISVLKEIGFFEKKPVRIGDAEITPVEFVSKLLMKEWKLEPGEKEFTVMKIIIRGEKDGKKKTVEYFLLDRYDTVTHTSSMARTTGYTCTAAANLLAKGLFTSKGVFPPELVGKDKACFDFVMDYLGQRNVVLKRKE